LRRLFYACSAEFPRTEGALFSNSVWPFLRPLESRNGFTQKTKKSFKNNYLCYLGRCFSLNIKRLYDAVLGGSGVTKSELIERIVDRQGQLSVRDVELAIKTMLDHMAQALAAGERIEIRGFGSFSLHYRSPRVGRNPKTGESVELEGKFVPHFKPGKELRESVNDSLDE